jgi:hypothetical protein
MGWLEGLGQGSGGVVGRLKWSRRLLGTLNQTFSH